MPEEEKTDVDDYAAEMYILEDMGVPESKLKFVKNKAAAQRIIDYMKTKQNQAPKEEPEETKIKKNMLNVGAPGDIDLPDPEILTDNIRKNMGDLLDRTRPIHYLNCRWNQNARIMRYYEEGNPHGRVL